MAYLAVTRKGFGDWRRVERHPERRWMVVLELPDSIVRTTARLCHATGSEVLKTEMHRNVLQLDTRDNVLIALTDLKAGERVDFGDQTFTVLQGRSANCARRTSDDR